MKLFNIKNKTVKIVLGIISTIILGAIGSGIWEKLLSPVSDDIIQIIGDFLSKISLTYKNSLYKDLGEGSVRIVGKFSAVSYAFLTGFFCYMTVFLTFKAISIIKKINGINKDSDDNKSSKNQKNDIFLIKIIIMPILFLMFIYVSTNGIRDSYRWDLIVDIERSIEIISPYISDNDLKVIKSEYRLVDNYESFEILKSKIIEISNDNDVILPNWK